MDIVGIGLCTFDILIKLPDLPTWDQPTCMEAVAIDGGGPCGTALCAASKLGAKPASSVPRAEIGLQHSN
jgi:hypothetical protein